MTTDGMRVIRGRRSTRFIADLLQTVFAAELLAPSERLWLVSPWVSDIPVLDNTAGQLESLVPQWERTSVRLSQVLIYLAEQGVGVSVATSTSAHNTPFHEAVRERNRVSPERVFLHKAAELHEKGLLGDGYYLAGSFNFTFSGITMNEEVALYHIDRAIVSENRIAFAERWGEGDE